MKLHVTGAFKAEKPNELFTFGFFINFKKNINKTFAKLLLKVLCPRN